MKKSSSREVVGKKAGRMVEEVSAGGFVFRRTKQGIEFAMMKDSYGKWAFPKGHQEAGESLEETAARETLEELGLEEIRLWGYLGKIEIWFRDRFQKPGLLIHKHIHFFLFSTQEDAELLPDPKERIQDAKWVQEKDVLAVSSYPDMAPIVERAIAAVRTWHP